MQYMGSKKRMAKHILPIMLKDRFEGQYWVEPFVGGANMIDKVDGHRIGADNHYYLISLLQAIQSGYIPPVRISYEEYYNIKSNPDNYPAELVGFVGFLCSFGGKWWGGFAKNNNGDNYAARGSRVLMSQAESIKKVSFICADYDKLIIPEKSIIYCDPPYKNTTAYNSSFDHDKFFNWCRVKFKDGHIIYLSEYNAPDDFICLTEIKTKTTLDKNSQYIMTEKLYTLK